MGLLALPEGHPGVSLRIDAPERTAGGRRRYDLAKLRHLAPHQAPSNRVTVLYARVATSGEKDDLVRQVALLESFAAANGWTYEVIEDVGSKLNHQKKGLRQLIARICSGKVGRLVVTHQDRLLRFGTEVIINQCFRRFLVRRRPRERRARDRDRLPCQALRIEKPQEPPSDGRAHQGG